MILLHDNAPSHTTKLVKETIEAFICEILSHTTYLIYLTLSNYYLLASFGHALAEQRFTSYENVQKWFDGWLASKDQPVFLAWHSQIVRQMEKMYK